MADVVSAQAEGPHTVVFTLARPDPLFPRLVSMLPIVEHGALERLGIEKFSLAPIGTGPYIVERFDTTRVSMASNPRGWQKTPSQKLEMVALGDSAARMQALVSGAIDVSLTIDPDDRPRVEAIGGKAYLSPINSSLVLLLRQTGDQATPLKNLNVRQALAHAVNREAITETIMGGAVQPATQMAAPNTIGYDPTITAASYDPVLAKRLLTKGGYPDGFTFTAKVIVGALMGDAPTYQQVAMDLQAIGVRMVLETVPPANLARDLRNGQWTTDAMINTYSADPLLDSLRAMRFNSCLNPATWVCDPAIQPVIEQAFAAETIEERDRLTRQVSRYYREQEYGLLLHTNARLSGLGPRVKRFEATSARIRWDRVIVEDKR
jgi:peptide/nickel transport system substrate-binding protein